MRKKCGPEARAPTWPKAEIYPTGFNPAAYCAPMTNEPAPDQRFAPIALWRVARRLMVTLFSLFGEPQELAFRHTLVARDYKAALNWLRSVEAMFRKLLLIEASYYAKEITHTKQRAPSKRERKLVSFVPENPDSWRVSFRASEAPGGKGGSARLRRACVAERCAPNFAPTTFHAAWPLAERFEALLRVHNNPAPYAKRLARKLHANAQRIAAIAKEPAELQHRIDPEPYASLAELFDTRTPAFEPNTS